MRITIHQPEHMPWLGFFHKIGMADVCVILDNVQFRKNYFQNRNKIRTTNGWCWITVPVKHKFGQYIKDTSIDNTNMIWKRKYWDSIYFSYKKAPFFDKYSETIKHILDQEWTHICELNIAFISCLLGFLNLGPRLIRASDIGVRGKGTALLLEICQKLGANAYVSGVSGKDYLNIKDFGEAGIEVAFQEFHHPIYKQLYRPFIPCMSIIDLLFNYGEKSPAIINGINVSVMEEVFL